jgi:hypothetical protein
LARFSIPISLFASKDLGLKNASIISLIDLGRLMGGLPVPQFVMVRHGASCRLGADFGILDQLYQSLGYHAGEARAGPRRAARWSKTEPAVFANWLDMRPADPDVLAIPDPTA